VEAPSQRWPPSARTSRSPSISAAVPRTWSCVWCSVSWAIHCRRTGRPAAWR